MLGSRVRRALLHAMAGAAVAVAACGGLAVADERPASAAAPEVVYAPNGPSGTVYRLYRAYFLREPDGSGYSYWTDVYAQGYPLAAISDAFARSPEFASRYGTVDDRQFVRLVYGNVLERTPDDDGYRYWSERMRAGMPRGHVMIHFSDSAEFRAKTAEGAPAGTSITIHSTSEITAAQLFEVQQSVIATRLAMEDRTPALVYVSSDPSAYAADYARHFGATVEEGRRVLADNSVAGTSRDHRWAVMFLNGATIFRAYESQKTAWVTTAHETVHTVQSHRAPLMGRPDADGTSTWGPLWLSEGHADYKAWRLTIAADAHPVHHSWQSLRSSAVVPRARNAGSALAELSTYDSVDRYGVDEVYAKATLAAEWLTVNVGADAIDRRYWEELSAGKHWPDAFNSAFGMTVESFYDRFDAWARAGYPAI